MQPIILPQFPQLEGEKAIIAPNNFIQELEEKDKKLIKEQTKILQKLVKGLISSIEAKQSRETPEEMRITTNLRAILLRHSQK